MKTKGNSVLLGNEITIIAKGAVVFLIGIALGTGFKYLFELAIARQLGAELYGQFIIGYSVFKILEIVSTLGIHNGILRYGALYKGEGDLQRVKGSIIIAHKVVAISSLFIGLILILLSKPISIHVFHNIGLGKVLVFFGLCLPFSVISMTTVFSIQSFKIMKYRVYVKNLIEPISRILIFIILLTLGIKLTGALSAFLFSCILGTFAALWLLKKVLPQITDKNIRPVFETKKLLTFSWPLLLTGFLNRTFMWIGTLLIGSFLAEKQAGIYGAALRTTFLGVMVLDAFSAIFAPIISDLYNKKELKKLENLFKMTTKWIFSASLPLFIVMVFYSKNILTIFGKDFIIGGICLIILSVGQLISSLGGSYGYMIMMSGRSKITLVNAALVSFSNIALALILIPHYGIVGAALASTISLSLITVIGILEVYIIFRIHPFRIDFFKPIIGGGASIAISILTVFYFLSSSSSLIQLVVGGALVFFPYCLLLFLFGLGEEEKLVIKKIKSKYF